LLHPVVVAGKLTPPNPFQNGPEQLSRNHHFRHLEDDLSGMANDLAPILINFSRNVVNVQWRLVCRDSASLIFTLVNDNVLISFTIPMNGTPERRERSGWGEHVDDSRNLGPHSL
jgi:hypothetical protein